MPAAAAIADGPGGENDSYKAALQQTRSHDRHEGRPDDQRDPGTRRAQPVFGTGFTVAATGGGSSFAGHVLERRRVLEQRRHLHDVSGTGTCVVQYNQAGDS